MRCTPEGSGRTAWRRGIVGVVQYGVVMAIELVLEVNLVISRDPNWEGANPNMILRWTSNARVKRTAKDEGEGRYK